MIRDGRDCAASNHRRWGQHPSGTIYRWKYGIREGRRQGLCVHDRYLEMRYEDITQDSGRYMREACEFAGLEFNDVVLTKSRVGHHLIGHQSKTIIRNQRRASAYFADSRRKVLEQIAGHQLADLGYETEFFHGDKDPAKIMRAWWFVHDAFRILTRQIRMKLTTQKRMTWPLFFRRIKMILRSRQSIRNE